MLLDRLQRRGLIHPPPWLPANLSFLGYAGSVAYGAESNTSDMDCFGFCMPQRHMLFPQSIGGEIAGFGRQTQRFRVWSEHHVAADEGKTYDFAIYNIVDFFSLAMENNPNILDVLFLPRRCILHSTPLAEEVRLNRRLFLHKGSFFKLRGYMFAQMSKIKNKVNAANPTRAALIAQHGYDTKFAMHVVRLALQAEQILVEHDLDLERNSEILKSVRRGEWTLEQIDQWASVKERALELSYAASTLRHRPDEERIKSLLLSCIEMHYGRMDDVIARTPSFDRLMDDLRGLVARYDRDASKSAPNSTEPPSEQQAPDGS